MRRTHTQDLALIFSIVLLCSWFLYSKAQAHAGHDAPSMAASDPNAPKKVTDETASLIGLKTAEVDFGPIEELLRLNGIVRARPDRVQVLSSPVAGRIKAVKVEIGDVVKKGDVLVEIDSAELAKLVVEARKAESDFVQASTEVVKAKSNAELLLLQAKAAEQKALLLDAELARVA